MRVFLEVTATPPVFQDSLSPIGTKQSKSDITTVKIEPDSPFSIQIDNELNEG